MSGVRAIADSSDFSTRQTRFLFIAILCVALALRLYRLTDAPAGWNQDEAANAWNAWCLLKTGVDQHGQPWPIFYFRALGENRNTLYLYLVIPCEWLFGLTTFSVRFPNVLGGVALVGILYFVGSRLFGRIVGLCAAGLLAAQPWNIYMSRWGNEGGMAGLLAVVPLAGLLWANLPPGQPNPLARRRAGVALVAGMVTGISCYGYYIARIFIPLFLALLVACYWRDWLRVLANHRARLSALAFVAGFLVLFGPLAFMHLRYPEEMNVRARQVLATGLSGSYADVASHLLGQYLHHFEPRFLFDFGDDYEEIWPSGRGVLLWISAPLMVLGMLWIVVDPQIRRGGWALLAWILLYPVGAILTFHMTGHAVRAGFGMGAAALLGGIGLGRTWLYLWQAELGITRLCFVGVFGAFIFGQCASFLSYLYFERPKEERARLVFHTDLTQACVWLGPRLSNYEAVYFTPTGFNRPFVAAVCAMKWNPRAWFAGPLASTSTRGFDEYTRVGKLRFLNLISPGEQLEALRMSPPARPVLFVVRPGELPDVAVIKIFCDGFGKPSLMVCAVQSEAGNPKFFH